MRRRWPTSLSRPRRDAWSLGWSRRCSVSDVMRSLSTATWTSVEPVSVSWRRCSAMISDLDLTIGTIVRRQSNRRSSIGGLPRWRGAQAYGPGQAGERRRRGSNLLALDVEQHRGAVARHLHDSSAMDLDLAARDVTAAVQRWGRGQRAGPSGLADDHHVEAAVVELGAGRDVHPATEVPAVGNDDAAHVALDPESVDIDARES